MVPGAPDDVADGALARLALAGAEEVEGLAVELARLDVVHELRHLRLESIGEGVRRRRLGGELVDKPLAGAELELVGLGVGPEARDGVGVGILLVLALTELGLEGGDAGVVVVVVAARDGEIGEGGFELFVRRGELGRERRLLGGATLHAFEGVGALGVFDHVLLVFDHLLVKLGLRGVARVVLDVELVLLLAGLLELVVLIFELVLEVGDDLVLVGTGEVLASAAVTDLEELAGVDDGLLQRLHLLLELGAPDVRSASWRVSQSTCALRESICVMSSSPRRRRDRRRAYRGIPGGGDARGSGRAAIRRGRNVGRVPIAQLREAADLLQRGARQVGR